jgi:hypothetical protein
VYGAMTWDNSFVAEITSIEIGCYAVDGTTPIAGGFDTGSALRLEEVRIGG